MGQVEPRIGSRLAKLMKAGNRYDAAITTVDRDEVRVIIHEASRTPPTSARSASRAAPPAGRVTSDRTSRAPRSATMTKEESEESEEETGGGRGARHQPSGILRRTRARGRAARRTVGARLSEAERKRLDHVVLPRRLPGLALLERYFPSPADNQLDAELTAFARAGDTVLDPWAGTGWTARRAIAHGMRVWPPIRLPSPSWPARPSCWLLSRSPSTLPSPSWPASRRVDVPLRQHLEELYATRCSTCRRPVVGEQFIWPRDGDAPGRKIYHCPNCDVSVGGPPERVAPIDDADLAKLGIDRPVEQEPVAAGRRPGGDVEDDLPPAPVGLTARRPETRSMTIRRRRSARAAVLPPWRRHARPSDRVAARRTAALRLDGPPRPGRAAGHRCAAEPALPAAARPIPGPRRPRASWSTSCSTCTRPRNLYALQTIANKIDAEFREPSLAAVFRLALAACLLPGSRLNGYPGRVASLRISGGHVRQPASRHQREVNVWRLFEAAVHDVRTADRRARPGSSPRALRGRPRRAGRRRGGQRALDPMPAGRGRAVPPAGRRRPCPRLTAAGRER